jgi:hypothetical protein
VKMSTNAVSLFLHAVTKAKFAMAGFSDSNRPHLKQRPIIFLSLCGSKVPPVATLGLLKIHQLNYLTNIQVFP